MAAMQDLVEEVERSFAETQERLSDPSVYNDHREAAEVGRRLKELEAAHKLATEWLEASSDLEAARDDGDLRELVPELEERVAQLEDDLGRVALLTRALMDAILKKGLLSQIELAEMMTKADMSDGERDGKLDLRSLRQRPPTTP